MAEHLCRERYRQRRRGPRRPNAPPTAPATEDGARKDGVTPTSVHGKPCGVVDSMNGLDAHGRQGLSCETTVEGPALRRLPGCTGGPEVIAMGPGGVRIGRDASCCDVVLPTRNVSRLHCVLTMIEDEICVHDKSTNGTFVNGRRVGRGRCCMLQPGDTLCLANAGEAEDGRVGYKVNIPVASMRTAALRGAVVDLQRYVLGPSIGQGSFAVVRLGMCRATSELVAIKVMEKQHFASQEAFAALHTEVAMMRSLQHPHIVKVLDVYESSDRVALVMEYVRGGDLFDYIVGRGPRPFNEDEVRFLCVQLVEALLYIHGRKVVHRDLKPENVLVDLPSSINTAEQNGGASDRDTSTAHGDVAPVLVAVTSEDHQARARSISPYAVSLKLTDFGLAKFRGEWDDICATDEDENSTSEEGQGACGGAGPHCARETRAVGTLAYTAPETLHFLGQDAPSSSSPEAVTTTTTTTAVPGPVQPRVFTTAMDVWSLGVLMYVMCSGALPHRTADEACKAAGIVLGPRLAHLSSSCRELLASMLRFDPAQRPTVGQLCSHPWFAGTSVAGRHVIDGDDDALSELTVVSPHLPRGATKGAREATAQPVATQLFAVADTSAPRRRAVSATSVPSGEAPKEGGRDGTQQLKRPRVVSTHHRC